jgi:hypothetical protein
MIRMLIALLTCWAVSLPSALMALSQDGFETAPPPALWSAMGNSTLTRTGSETVGGCPSVVPLEGSFHARWSSTSISSEAVTIRYTPVETTVPNYVVVDIFSCGIQRQIGIRVVGNGGANVVFATSTSCGDGFCVRNGWDHLFADMTSSGMTAIDYVEIITSELSNTQYIYVDNINGSSVRPPCDTGSQCIAQPSGFTCTPTMGLLTATPTMTPTECIGLNGDTCTPFPSPTMTGTPTPTFTPTLTPTSTPWPIMVFPNPMNFQEIPPNSNYCPPEMTASGCIKFIGLPIGSSMKIYTLALSLVRTFEVEDVAAFGAHPVVQGLINVNSQIGWVAWSGDNDDRNPVSAGIYFYVVEPPQGEKFIGRLAISRARKLN